MPVAVGAGFASVASADGIREAGTRNKAATVMQTQISAVLIGLQRVIVYLLIHQPGLQTNSNAAGNCRLALTWNTPRLMSANSFTAWAATDCANESECVRESCSDPRVRLS